MQQAPAAPVARWMLKQVRHDEGGFVRILLTNDDGYHAPGLEVLEEIAAHLSDDVWVVAPADEQSGAGHSLTLTRPIRVRRHGDKRFAVAGTLTDAVMMALAGTVGRQQAHDPGHRGEGECQEGHLHAEHQREHGVDEALRAARLAGLFQPRVGRHEGDVEGALAEDRAEVVRQPEGHDEGVRDRSGAHHGGHHHVPAEARGARDEGPAADREDAADQGASPPPSAAGAARRSSRRGPSPPIAAGPRRSATT